MEYIEADKKKTGSEKCVFCSQMENPEREENLVVHLGKSAAVLLNKFPYNNGHLMVMPIRHVGRLDEIKEEEILEIFSLTKKSLQALRAAMEPHGFNMGLNLGKTAGAGIEEHLHLHIVPRWEGDTSFMPVLAETKVIPEHFMQTFRKLKKAFAEIE